MTHGNRNNIQYLYRMIHHYTLDSTLKYGILSHNEANKRGLINPIYDISNPDVQNRRHQIHDYVCLYFSPRNPMLYFHRNRQQDIIFLGVDFDIISEHGAGFTDGNAASYDTQFYWDIAQLNQLKWEILNAPFWGNYPDGKRIKCAEVLIPHKIDVQKIIKIFCYTEIQKESCKKIIFSNNIELCVEVDRSLYF